MEFEFIDNNSVIDGRSRKAIRRHVMIGKNSGRVIPARGHRKLERKVQSKSPLSTRPGNEQLVPELDHNPFAGSEFSLFRFDFPVSITPPMRRLIYQCEEPERPGLQNLV